MFTGTFDQQSSAGSFSFTFDITPETETADLATATVEVSIASECRRQMLGPQEDIATVTAQSPGALTFEVFIPAERWSHWPAGNYTLGATLVMAGQRYQVLLGTIPLVCGNP